MTAEAIAQGHLLCDMRRGAEAAELAVRLLAQDPENVQAWLVLARSRLVANDRTGARDAAESAVGLAPDMAYAHVMVGVTLDALGRHGDAATAFGRAIWLEPDNPQGYELLAGALNAAALDPEQAVTVAETAVRMAPDRPSAHVTYGTALAATGQHAAAKQALQRALALDPASAEAHHELARVDAVAGNALNAGRLADAASGFATAVQMDPYAQESRTNLDKVLRIFQGRLSHLLLALAIIAARLASRHPDLARLAAVAVIAVPAGYAAWFVIRLAPAVRSHLRDALASGWMRMNLVLVAVAEGLLVAATLLPQHVWGLTIAAALVALILRATK